MVGVRERHRIVGYEEEGPRRLLEGDVPMYFFSKFASEVALGEWVG
jgi:hypothetical protein